MFGARYVFDFEPIAVETLGVFNASARRLFGDLGQKISPNSGEARETSYLYQMISILVQRFSAVLLHDSLPAADSTYPSFSFSTQFLNSLGIIFTEGKNNNVRGSANGKPDS